VSPSPTPSPPAHLYVTEGDRYIFVYDLPLRPSSTPSLIVSVGSAGNTYCPLHCFGGLVASKGKLYVADYVDIRVFTLPLSSSSSPVQTLMDAPGGGGYHLGVTADAAGTIYATNDAEQVGVTALGPGVDVYRDGATSATFFLVSAAISFPDALAVDSNGDLFVNNDNTTVGYFAAPITASSWGISFPRNSGDCAGCQAGIATDSRNNLYAAQTSETGQIDIFHPPYSSSSRSASTVSFSTLLGHMQIARDGTMYIIGNNATSARQIVVLSPPYTSFSFTVIVPNPLPFSMSLSGIALGP
jgi:hypothetical protein